MVSETWTLPLRQNKISCDITTDWNEALTLILHNIYTTILTTIKFQVIGFFALLSSLCMRHNLFISSQPKNVDIFSKIKMYTKTISVYTNYQLINVCTIFICCGWHPGMFLFLYICSFSNILTNLKTNINLIIFFFNL